jgi:protocatechuate 3,4-dioxygenase beta subunit
MATRREKLLVAGLVAFLALIVAIGFLSGSGDEDRAPAVDEEAPRRIADDGEEQPGALPGATGDQREEYRAPGGARPGEPDPAEPAPAPEPEDEQPRAPGPIGVLAGKVTGPDGQPVAGAEIALSYHLNRSRAKYPDADPKKARPRTATCDSYGEFRFEGLPPGFYFLAATHPEFAGRRLSGVELTETFGVEGLAVILVGEEGTGSIEGLVTDRAGAPESGRIVAISGMDGGTRAVTRTGEDGAFRFDKLLPGSYKVTLRPRDGRAAYGKSRSRFVQVGVGQTTRVEFEGSGTLRGTVLDAKGNPMPEVFVRIAPLDERGRFRGGNYKPTQAMTDADGRFEIEDAGEGPHEVKVQQVKGGSSFATKLENIDLSGEDQDVTLQLESSGITGRVTVAETGRPPDGTHGVVLYRKKPWGSVGMAFLDREGRFEFKSVPPDSYKLFLTADGYRRVERELDIAEGEKKTGVDIVLEKLRPGTIVLRVKDQDGKPVEGLSLSYNSSEGLWTGLRSDQTEPGVYVVKQLETGTWTLSLWRRDLQGEQVEVKVAEGKTTTVDVTMAPRPEKPGQPK